MADTAVWETLADAPAFGTLAEGKAHLLTRDLGTNRVWKADRASPGNGVTRAGFICNAHVHCQFRARVVRKGGAFEVQTVGTHSVEENEKKRSNSALTKDQERAARWGMSTGSKPAANLSALTTLVLDEALAVGATPEKREDGGLEGAEIAALCLPRDPPRLPPLRGCRLCVRTMYSH